MKAIFLILVCFMSCQIVTANKIDDLHNDSDVQIFLRRLSKNFATSKTKIVSTDSLFVQNGCKVKITDKQIRNWEKADLNGDGNTDIIINTTYSNLTVFVVIDKGDNTFNVFTPLGKRFNGCQLARSLKVGNRTMIKFYSEQAEENKAGVNYITTNHLQTDTLICQYGGIVEYNANPVPNRISAIDIETTQCFGTCPVYKIHISADGKASYNAIAYNPEQGTFNGTIDAFLLKDILSFTEYMSVKKLQDNYIVNWTDDQTAITTVSFADGSKKSITDYGMLGTIGLQHLYTMLDNLRRSQNWYD